MEEKTYFKKYHYIYGASYKHNFSEWQGYFYKFTSLKDFKEWQQTQENDFRTREFLTLNECKKMNLNYLGIYK